MYLAKTPAILKPLASDLVWDVQTDKKEVFLTFDDGPIPEVTPLVLDILDQFSAKGTFFCVGENVGRHPDVFHDVIARGHAVGNHTYKHENGWRTGHVAYLKSALKCAELVKSDLFRPPYGRIRKAQADSLKKRFNLIMWDVLSGDFDENRSSQVCLSSLKKYTKAGSVIVFHDSIKAKRTILDVLPSYLKFLKEEGYSCALLTSENTRKLL